MDVAVQHEIGIHVWHALKSISWCTRVHIGVTREYGKFDGHAITPVKCENSIYIICEWIQQVTLLYEIWYQGRSRQSGWDILKYQIYSNLTTF